MTPFASSWTEATGGPSVPARPFPIRGRAATLLLLAAGFAWSLSRVDWGQPVLHANGLDAVGRIAAAALQPDLSPEILRLAVASAARTAAYATAGVSLAIVLALPAGILASGTLARSLPGQSIAIAVRGVLGLARAIHELVWAWLFVAAVGLSPLAAVLALAIPYAGLLGRILADMLNDVPQAPLASLATSGAGPAGQLLYGRLPIVLPNAVGYAMFRWECGL
ncbi:MAG TPA: hypothetical protein VER37_08475, partial [Thermomicrobiales bacterium]|nr:hypothetical protein [Thermomicrobiales bacterium]